MSSIKQITLPNLVTYDIDGKKVTLTTTDPGAGSSLAQGKMIAVVGDEPPAPTPSYIPPSWTEGTDAEILVALEKHYNDEIDLTEYWSIGDERIFQIQAIPKNSSTTNLEAQPAQSITMVLSNVGGYELVTSINGHTECAFRIDQKNCLSEIGKMHKSQRSSGSFSWINCTRKQWLNDEYYNAFSILNKQMFKQFKYKYRYGPSSSVTTDINGAYFVLSAESESTNTLSTLDTYKEGDQIDYYKTSSNLIKNINNIATDWWTRTLMDISTEYYCTVTSAGSRNYDSAYSKEYGIAPFGVI